MRPAAARAAAIVALLLGLGAAGPGSAVEDAAGSDAAPAAALPDAAAAPLHAALPALLAALRSDADAGARTAGALQALAEAQGVAVPPPARCPTLEGALADHAGRLGLPAPTLPAAAPLLDAATKQALACLLGALHEANLAMDATFAGIAPGDLVRLAAAEDDPAPGLRALLDGRSHGRNLAAAAALARAVGAALPALDALRADLADGRAFSRLGIDLGIGLGAPCAPLDVPPLLFVDACGDTLHDDNYALLVDLAGNDTYDNHAGGVFLAVGNAFFEVEPGSAYLQQNVAGQNVAVAGDTQDADFAFSAGLAIDLAGDDAWGVKRAPILTDAANGCGNATSLRVPIVDTIGGGVLGVGMAFDLAGDNVFLGRTQTQGAGHVFGVGVLVTGPGRDRHEAVRGAMGSGLLGGVGLLLDEGGNSTYTLVAPPGGVFNGDRRFCDDDPRYGIGSNFDRKDGPFTPQVGILADLGGDDRYVGVHRAAAFSQGSGFGLLLDADGNDRYEGRNVTQGAGHGRAVPFEPEAPWSGGAAFLLDLAGDDAYAAAGEAQGWALGDLQDDPTPPTDLDGLLQWAAKREEALGVLFDAAGTDTYTRPGRGDGATGTDGTLGVFVDAA